MEKKIAIYSRKSKFNEKSESTDNQIQICKQYAIQNFNAKEEDFLIFEDDGFSGKDIIRPDFQKMFSQIKANKVHTLIVYRLDRISRSVADASNIIETLTKCDTNFVSISEKFDTTTPIGKAMINVSSTFAQLERETIAERIKDNFLELAKKGRWTGGQTPTGYKSISVQNGDKKAMYLEQDQHIHIIKIIFEKYMEMQNLSKLCKFLANNNLKSKNGNYFLVNTIRDILINPVYAYADIDIYNYYSEKGCTITMSKENFSGSYGVVPYNRYNKPIEEWYISVGIHEPIVTGSYFVKIQNIIQANHHKNIRSGTGTHGVLQGIIYCKCGALMRPKTGKKDNNGVLRHYYYCTRKENSNRLDCNEPTLIGRIIDAQILDFLSTVLKDTKNFKLTVLASTYDNSKSEKVIDQRIQEMQELIDTKNKQLWKIAESIMENESSDFVNKFLVPKGDDLAIEIKELKKELILLHHKKVEVKDIDKTLDSIIFNMKSLFNDSIDSLDTLTKRRIIKNIINQIDVSDDVLTVRFKNLKEYVVELK